MLGALGVIRKQPGHGALQGHHESRTPLANGVLNPSPQSGPIKGRFLPGETMIVGIVGIGGRGKAA